jgi:hypothetical protein
MHGYAGSIDEEEGGEQVGEKEKATANGAKGTKGRGKRSDTDGTEDTEGTENNIKL